MKFILFIITSLLYGCASAPLFCFDQKLEFLPLIELDGRPAAETYILTLHSQESVSRFFWVHSFGQKQSRVSILSLEGVELLEMLYDNERFSVQGPLREKIPAEFLFKTAQIIFWPDRTLAHIYEDQIMLNTHRRVLYRCDRKSLTIDFIDQVKHVEIPSHSIELELIPLENN